MMAQFLPAVSNVSISEYVYLTLDEDSGEYVGTITITEDTYPCEWVLSSLNVRDENGNMTNLQRNRNASAIVKTLVRNLPVAGCFIFIQRRTCVLIQGRCVVHRNGIPPTKSV